ncbi:MAG: hypothetical protein JHC26_09770 [Thermofilum sp.]|jgi:hypothetical protein|uniref:hypothetical protein n=1 Tax=Thermofilum sp. TaxID=1961369 RepID=UPI00258D2F72|nr:hypothetical protein [Thermofilum sp.]MCI4409369.1 hypothetical protein [Thermofilum sp.]
MKSITTNVIVLFFRGLAESFLYYVVPLVAFFAEVLLLGFLLVIFNASLYHSYVWLTVIVAVAILLMPKLFYETFLKLWNGAKKALVITYTPGTSMTELEEIKYAYMFALIPTLMIDWTLIVKFGLDITGGDIPKQVTAFFGFMITVIFYFVLLCFAEKQFSQLIRKCRNS